MVQLVADYVELTGDEYLIDVRNLRSGEEWATRLEELIAEADIFQLFWSTNSMASEYVRREWEHALGLDREEFIRPVYWEVPMPADLARGLPPEHLRRLQFAQLPLGRAQAPPGRAIPVLEAPQLPSSQAPPAPPASFPEPERLPPAPPSPDGRRVATTMRRPPAPARRSGATIILAVAAALVCVLIALFVLGLL